MCNPSQGFYGENNLDDEMTKPYLLIAGDNYYPSADTGDWVGCFSTYEEAKAQVEPKKTKGYTVNGRDWGCDWYEIVDLREWTE